jgi:hypothetical protein
MDVKPPPIMALIRKGCLPAGCLTSIVWFFALSVIVGTAMGDCFPDSGSPCLSDHERNMTIVGIAIAALVINVAGLFFIARDVGRSRDGGR